LYNCGFVVGLVANETAQGFSFESPFHFLLKFAILNTRLKVLSKQSATFGARTPMTYAMAIFSEPISAANYSQPPRLVRLLLACSKVERKR
jgi:hypothetical protein